MTLCTIKGFTSTYLICFTLVNSVLYSTFAAQNKSTQVQYLQKKSTQVLVQYLQDRNSIQSMYCLYCIVYIPLSPSPPGKRLPRGSGGVRGFHGCPPSFFQPTFFQL